MPLRRRPEDCRAGPARRGAQGPDVLSGAVCGAASFPPLSGPGGLRGAAAGGKDGRPEKVARVSRYGASASDEGEREGQSAGLPLSSTASLPSQSRAPKWRRRRSRASLAPRPSQPTELPCPQAVGTHVASSEDFW